MFKRYAVIVVILLCSCSVTNLNLQFPQYQHMDSIPQSTQSGVVIEKQIEVPKIQIVKEPVLIKGSETKIGCPKYLLPKQPNLSLPKDIKDLLKNDQQKGIEALLKHIQELHQFTADVNKTYSLYSGNCKN